MSPKRSPRLAKKEHEKHLSLPTTPTKNRERTLSMIGQSASHSKPHIKSTNPKSKKRTTADAFADMEASDNQQLASRNAIQLQKLQLLNKKAEIKLRKMEHEEGRMKREELQRKQENERMDR
ncbi:hypothetical protein JAAARDRAFT_187252, partial [Jaapia argillacea MUCL 33604]